MSAAVQQSGFGHTTTFEEFADLARDHRVVPVTRKVLADAETPLSAYQKLAGDRPGTFLLESAENGRSWSRWSFIGAGTPSALTVADGEAHWWGTVPDGAPTGGDPLEVLGASLKLLATDPLPGMPPLTGGFVGFMAYDMVRRLENLPSTTVDDLGLPDLVMLLATDIAAVDHHEGTITLIANAVNWDGTDDRVHDAYDDAIGRLDTMTAALAAPLASTVAQYDRPAPEYTAQRDVDEYGAVVRAMVGEIQAGEAFQVVPSVRFEMETTADPLDVYRVLRASNPSPYMYLLRMPGASEATGGVGASEATGGVGASEATGDATGQLAGHGIAQEPFTIVGSSPEALVTVADRVVTTHPIAGTRWRGATEEEDLLLGKGLLEDPKENAEHLMLVDLGRNDLGRVCRPGTVKVSDYCHIERYSHVMHLVSTVSGTLRDDQEALDAVTACFPAGTLSGAPKVRAMELIEEHELTRRGLYGGIVGYLDFAGNADTAIAIRTGILAGERAFVQAGAGVVADSDPVYEYTEAKNKAMAVLNAIAAAGTMRRVGDIS
ncbi:anthranilate synthase component I [Gordonia sp. (in: high G+C Gram-positive bacteria)]|uniref:anthranilate synthase component I n=1 Tax=Gordonia sp. (in: high G+C Gram-positive bacteria) TaxID=84139 RepID=UPI002BE74A6D|nr:anthranilate synthase component I [Gordonia sp. (in: high G+C Gram-positive bacteria)]HMS75272.1 anthranilate synthase component I [Gordonia sp. (in: high G+C Gram-positive bacteria)]